MNTQSHKDSVLALCDVIRETSYAVYNYLRSGHREQIYENALAHRLSKLGVTVEQQSELRVYDEDGTLLGHLRADLLIENKLICEIKGVRGLVDEHVAQLLGYLRAARIEHGLLNKRRGPRLEIRKFIVN